jgi:hypothetical protein
MGSPVFVKRVWLCERGSSREPFFVVRSIVEPIWAGPSLRTIFMDKNIAGYCRYIGLVSFVEYRPDNAVPINVHALPSPVLLRRAKHGQHHVRRGDNASNDLWMTQCRSNDEI